MILRTGAQIDNAAAAKELSRIINQIYKLLPSREENIDWERPLSTIIQELSGMDRLLLDYHDILFALLSKLEGLFLLLNEDDFLDYRRTIFECLSLANELKEKILECKD